MGKCDSSYETMIFVWIEISYEHGIAIFRILMYNARVSTNNMAG
jgi:hypothetical protein